MKTPPTSHRVCTVVIWAAGIVAVLILAAFVSVSRRIGADVRAASALAMAHHEGDRVAALLRFAEDDRHSYSERNRAVWALGQLGDRRALAGLRKHHTGKPCDHARSLCQRELGKAIKLVEGGWNVTAMVWRRPTEERRH